jgi:MoaE-MoaD fusion protein
MPRETFELPAKAVARDALEKACAAHPALRPVADKLRLAVDQEFSDGDRPLRDGSEIALIPPVSGGAGPHRVLDAPLDPAAAIAEVSHAGCGAVVTFIGTVRDHARGKEVLRLEYEAYPAMAVRVFARIAGEAEARWPGSRVCIHHRVGSLEPGALSVVIAASSAHRADAFDACRHAIEELKKDAPIWKREHYPDGSVWVGLGS